jgi:hypothetical protein
MGAPIPIVTCYFTKDISDKNATKKLNPSLVDYNLETGICSIVIKNAQANEHEGFYMVKAWNDAGQLTSACAVKIEPKSYPLLELEADCAPKFTTELIKNIRVMDGQEVSFNCVCAARPGPNIEWFRRSLNQSEEDFVPVKLSSDLKWSFDSSTGRCLLRITDTYPQDAGCYLCIARNQYGEARTQTILIVDCKLKQICFCLFV